jgi:hypothetical protein
MAELRWNKIDFIECFGVLPETDECGSYYEYTVARRGLVLLVIIEVFECVIELHLRREDCSEDVISFALLVEGEAELKREKWGNYLKLSHCRVVADQRYYMLEDGAESVSQGADFDVEVMVDPDIRITFS